MTACITRPFYAVYNSVSSLASRFFIYITEKVNAVAMRFFTGYLTACKKQVFKDEFQRLDQVTQALKDLQKPLSELETDLKGLADNLTEFPDALNTALKELIPDLPVDPLQRSEVLAKLAAQVEKAQKTADAAATVLGSFFTK